MSEAQKQKGYSRWEDIKRAKIPPERLAKIEAEVAEEVRGLRLRELRKRLGLTQVQASERIDTSQADLSKVERRRDHKLSTVQRYVEGLGGKLRITAVFPDGQEVEI